MKSSSLNHIASISLIFCSILQLCISFSSEASRKSHLGNQRHRTLQMSVHENDQLPSMAEMKVAHVDLSLKQMRRSFLLSCGSILLGVDAFSPKEALAQTDCMSDCLKNCKLIAPKDPAYCLDNCQSYCAQEDRTDGLSGSISSEGGEKGILGTTTVVKGEDKPPSISLPGLDFTSEKGRKLIGY